MSINFSAIPFPWEKSRPHLGTLVRAFQDAGIFEPKVYAYACASICFESSWNPFAENTKDSYAGTAYSGKGLAQVTSRENYQAISYRTGIDFLNNPYFMFDPYKSLRAKAEFFKMNNMLSLILIGNYEAAAGIYNAYNSAFRSDYTRNVAVTTPLWFAVFNYLGNSNYNTYPAPPPLNLQPAYHNISNPYPNPPSPQLDLNYAAIPTSSAPSLYSSQVVRNNSPKSSSPPNLSQQVYTVQRGDFLSKIAKKFNTSLDSLAKANPQIKDLNKIRVGEKVFIA